MESYFILARSVTTAQRIRTALAAAGVRSQIARAKREISSMGCAYTVEIAPQDLARALAALRRAGIEAIQVYLHRGGVYREIVL